MSRIRLTLAYDGAAYSGWQVQPNAPSIQQSIEEVLAKVEGRPVALTAAGRTDAGVHALGQAAHFDTARELDAATWRRALNAQLPRDISVMEAEAVGDDFHARFSPSQKHYRYRVLNRPVRCPFRRGLCWFVPVDLDVRAMRKGAEHLLGEHDFTSFRASGCGAAHAVRTVTELEVARVDEEIHFDVRGPAFLKQMVRNMVGTLMEVGRGRQSPEWVAEVLSARDRTAGGETAPAWGLTMMSVTYRSR